ncbi:MAG: succinylglutamate desuccinylase/aspartoacylase family protein, partial [Salinisphaera sp.]|nr:succinylglutamate desuccinylase/aspartoacylase family protein [Salinisphaera sp.]
SGFRSVRGWPIPVRDVAIPQQWSRGRVLLIGGIHGDELTSVSLTFWWLANLEDEGSAFAWRVAPLVNPDGMFAHPPTRVNAHGVDLNRNMPTAGWEQASAKYWRYVGRRARRYPGDSAASEPETRWLVHAIKAFQPDIIVSLHAPYGLLDYDGDLTPPPKLGDLPLHNLRVYPGSLGNYGAHGLDIPVITIELADATQMPTPNEARRMWEDLNAWIYRSLTPIRQARAQ